MRYRVDPDSSEAIVVVRFDSPLNIGNTYVAADDELLQAEDLGPEVIESLRSLFGGGEVSSVMILESGSHWRIQLCRVKNRGRLMKRLEVALASVGMPPVPA